MLHRRHFGFEIYSKHLLKSKVQVSNIYGDLFIRKNFNIRFWFYGLIYLFPVDNSTIWQMLKNFYLFLEQGLNFFGLKKARLLVFNSRKTEGKNTELNDNNYDDKVNHNMWEMYMNLYCSWNAKDSET